MAQSAQTGGNHLQAVNVHNSGYNHLKEKQNLAFCPQKQGAV